MDDLLREFLTETKENLDVIDVEVVRFEQDPNNAKILEKIFRLVHTIKGTCGFLGLPRLEKLSHAAETLMARFRDGVPVTSDAVTLILSTLDRLKDILAALDAHQKEPSGDDNDLIQTLDRMVKQGAAAKSAARHAPAAPPAPADHTVGQLVPQVLERPLQPGEDSLDDLERAFRETPGPASAPATAESEKPAAAKSDAKSDEDKSEARAANHSIRVNLGTLENLMTMVS